LYLTLLQPFRVPDAFLTKSTAGFACYILSGLDPGARFISREVIVPVPGGRMPVYDMYWICRNGHKSLGIADGCNGLELMALYGGFLFCMPTSTVRLLGFLAGGTLLIFAVNAMRCMVIARMCLQRHPLADMAHHYLFKLLVYGLVFGMWVLYVRREEQFM